MNDEKGKGRASDHKEHDKPPINDPPFHSSSTLLDRVTASATGLAQSTFAAPSSNELSNVVSSALTSAGKGRQVGRSSSSWAESSRANQNGIPAPQGQSAPSLRTTHREEHIIDAESQFSSFLDGIDSFTPSSEPYDKADTSSPGLVLDVPPKRAGGVIYTHSDQVGEIQHNTVDEQQHHDGDAVLTILSYPSATTDGLEAFSLEEEKCDWNLTDQQISQLRPLLDELFPPSSQHISMPVEHPLNLVPNMVSISTASDPVPSTEAYPEDSYQYFGDITRNMARQMWMEQWEDVLSRYTDEVWGSLLPLVVEAREEVKAIKDDYLGATIEQSKALRRLKLVLDHVRKL